MAEPEYLWSESVLSAGDQFYYNSLVRVKTRILKVLTAIVVLLSVGTASVSACTCSHPESGTEVVGPEHSHEHSDAASGGHHHDEEAGPDGGDFAASSESCVCTAAIVKASPKSEFVKFQKPAPTSGIGEPLVPPFAEAIPVDLPVLERPFYLCDSFHNLAPKRGPPIV